MNIHQLASLFLKLASTDKSPTAPAAKIYQETYGVNLTPGPSGSKGRIYFIDSDASKVVKFTTDESEAANMHDIMIAQQKSNKFSSVIKVYKVLKMKSLPIYVIEQERGVDLTENLDLLSYLNKLLYIIGRSPSKSNDKQFDCMLNDLEDSDNKNFKDIAKTVKQIRKTVDPSYKDMAGSNFVYIPSPKDGTPQENTKMPFEDDYLSDVNKRLKGKLKLIDLGYSDKKPKNIPIL